MSVLVFVAETVDSIRSKMVGYMQSANSKLSNWIAGGIGQQLVETIANTTQAYTDIAARAARGFASLDTSTDPGDVDPYDPENQSQPWAPGFLSDKGSNEFGTERIRETFAVGALTFANTGAGAVNQTLAAFSVTFQRNYANSDGSYPTYRNSSAISCLAGATVSVPIEADVVGTSSNATAASVTVLVSTLPGVTVTNANAVLGTDLQPADAYRAACREEAALTSPNGPSDSYRYLATTGRDDGTWGNSTTGNSLGITRTYVSESSSTGIVTVYYAGAAGGAGLSGAMPNASGPFTAGVTTFVQAANYLISKRPGVISVPDATTFSGAAATDVSIAFTYAVKAKASSVPGALPGTYTKTGGAASSPNASADAVFTAIDAQLTTAFLASKDIGGDDQTAGAGTIYADECKTQIGSAWPTTYHTTMTLPAADVSLAAGQVAVAGTMTRTVILT